MRKTIEQERASFCIEERKKFKDDKKFKTNTKRFPELIVSNGLIPALAFYKAKEERKRVYNILNKWLKNKKYITNDALEELVNADVDRLRLVTVEALALATWLKRVVEVEIKDEKS